MAQTIIYVENKHTSKTSTYLSQWDYEDEAMSELCEYKEWNKDDFIYNEDDFTFSNNEYHISFIYADEFTPINEED